MNKWKAIFWDWNGTLLNDVQECIEIINVCLKKRNLPEVSQKLYLEEFTFPVKKYYEAIGFDFSKETFEDAGKEYIEAYSDKMFDCSLHSGAVNALKTFKRNGHSQFVLSALNSESLHQCIKKFELEEFFEKVRGLDNSYAHSKVELGKSLIKELDINPGKVLMIGDTTHDFETASAMGVDCVLIANGHNSRKRLEECGVPVFSGIEQLLKELNG